MPIPAFDATTGVLPPHLGNPCAGSQNLTPFPATSEEVCQRFATSPERCAILSKWLDFRQQLLTLGITKGFQWLGGSFMENVEILRFRPPNDMDVVTFFEFPSGHDSASFLRFILTNMREFLDHSACKIRFKLDHFSVPLEAPGVALVTHTRYWTGFFSHTRDKVWKGMLQIELNTPASDTAAGALLPPLTP